MTLENIIKNFFIASVITATALFGCGTDAEDYASKDKSYSSEDTEKKYSREETNKNLLMDEGVCIGSWWHDDYNGNKIDDTLEKLHGLGVESVSILMVISFP